METVKETLGYWLRDWYMKDSDPIAKHLDKKVIKQFSCGMNRPWLSWQEFGVHKNVTNWWLTEDGYAIGLNENPSTGWNFPVKRLSKEVFEKAKNHTKTYDEYFTS